MDTRAKLIRADRQWRKAAEAADAKRVLLVAEVVAALGAGGMSMAQVAEVLGVSKAMVAKMAGPGVASARGGRPPKTG